VSRFGGRCSLHEKMSSALKTGRNDVQNCWEGLALVCFKGLLLLSCWVDPFLELATSQNIPSYQHSSTKGL